MGTLSYFVLHDERFALKYSQIGERPHLFSFILMSTY
jgi:hypothetical protein